MWRAAVVYGEDAVLVVEEHDGVPFDVYDEALLSLQFLEAGDADVRGDLAVEGCIQTRDGIGHGRTPGSDRGQHPRAGR